jgi:hypothetical protein
MIRYALAGVLLTAFLADPAKAGEKGSPKTYPRGQRWCAARPGKHIKMKIKQVQPQVPPTPTLPLAPS